MKKWIIIGLGLLFGAAIIDGVIYYRKRRAEMEAEVLNEFEQRMRESNQRFVRHCEEVLDNMKVVDQNIEETQNAQEWLDRLLHMTEEEMLREFPIDP